MHARLPGIESAPPRIVEHAVLDAVEGVARLEHRGVHDRELGGGMKLAGSLCVACAIHTPLAIRCVQLFAGAPAMMPS